MRPDTFTITTFWLDWLRMPVMLAGAWFTTRWALADSRQSSFPSLVRIWKLSLGLEYLDAFPISVGWRIAGAVKLLVGSGIVAILFIASRRLTAWEMLK
jgi:hypothetical protein